MTAALADFSTAPKPPARRWPSPLMLGLIALLIVAHVFAWQGTDVSIKSLIEGRKGMADFLDEAIPLDLTWSTVLRPGLEAALVTLYIGLLGTTLSIPFALGMGMLASRATTPNTVLYQATRSILSFLRSVPDVVFALIFVCAVGLGPFAGVLALVFHNTGVMGKLWAEAMEETDLGPRDVLRIGGANGVQTALHAVLPTSLPQLVGLLLYRFDVNVRSSLVLGLVGAGGIGFLINEAIKTFKFDVMATHILIVLVLVIAVDQVSAQVRKRIGA
ncbi:phosphonate ABC transporter, permease protein PhnE [Pseudonocardiaceae bacterium YIM PH 21723]|nr:phosphonate ABC transporter, permease protein PhnE [Pseudonocardiaceae bacterium YIM PH 21723]